MNTAKPQSPPGDRRLQRGLVEAEDRNGDGRCPAVATGQREGHMNEESPTQRFIFRSLFHVMRSAG